MVIFDRIGRDSDCRFMNCSSEKNSIQIGKAPLAKLTEIHSPGLLRGKSFKNQNAFLQRTKSNYHPPTWCSNTNFHFCCCNSRLAEYSEKISRWYQLVNALHDTQPRPCNEMKKGLFPALPNQKVPMMHCSAKLEVMQRGSGQENAWHYPDPLSSN